jgi:carboxyl-terminal processing protease
MRRGERFPLLTNADEAGMGAQITWDGDSLVASRIDPDGLAARTGLVTGDAVVLKGFRGAPNGGRLDLAKRAGDRNIVLEWQSKAPPPARSYSLFAEGSAHLRFDEFDKASVDWVLEQLQTPHKSLVLDLRDNSGGLLIQCHRLLSAFLPAKTALGAFKTRTGNKPMRASAGVQVVAPKVVILTGMRTMSSAEILSQNLKAYNRAVLIGDRTAGAVLAATAHELPDGGKLIVPFADYLTPSGQSLEGVGVAPSILTERLDEASLVERAEELALTA